MKADSLILVVEDEVSIADNIRISLKSEGFECKCVSLAQDAIDAVENDPISLVVLDVGSPDFTGFEACKKIRKSSSVPIIFLTARGEEIDRVVGLEIGANDYITKPFSPRELVARVKLRLRDFEQAKSNVTNCMPNNRFLIDEKRKTVTFQSVALDLTAFEFGILKTLLEQPERVFSRGQLIASVRHVPEVVLERAIDNHIKTIRAKLKSVDSSDSPIKTHRGLGYSIHL